MASSCKPLGASPVGCDWARRPTSENGWRLAVTRTGAAVLSRRARLGTVSSLSVTEQGVSNPAGPERDSGHTCRAASFTFKMLCVQRLRRLSHPKLKDTTPEHLDLSSSGARSVPTMNEIRLPLIVTQMAAVSSGAAPAFFARPEGLHP